MSTRTTTAMTSGWLVFAGTMLATVGIFNLIYGLALLFNDTYFLLVEGTAGPRILVFDLTVAGWTLLVLGVLLIATAYGALMGQTWARVTGIVLAGINAISNLAWVDAQPWWALAIIAIDVLIIYALAVHGDEVAG